MVTYEAKYGPEYDYQGISREYAVQNNYHYVHERIDGEDVYVYVKYDPDAGCYHM